MLGCGILIWSILAWITWLGPQFDHETSAALQPVLLITSLLILASVLSIVALAAAVRVHRLNRDILFFIISLAFAFRLVQLFSPPFKEVDLYRYMWDGIVASKGHSPYRFSPEQVLNNRTPSLKDKDDLNSLHEIAILSNSNFTILSRVHFPEYTTIYPPVSQTVFAGTMSMLSDETSVKTRLFVIKAVITTFDFGSFLLILALLSRLKMSPGWSLAYGWNPLVIKEFSNSGHLDSIAVFFVVASALCLVISLEKKNEQASDQARIKQQFPWMLLLGSLFLGLGVASKIYPVILFPFTILFLFSRLGWKAAILHGTVFFLTAGLAMLPMVLALKHRSNDSKQTISKQPSITIKNQEASLDGTFTEQSPDTLDITLQERDSVNTRNEATNESTRSGPGQSSQNSETESKEGLTSFLKKWQMNELIYMVIHQNLKRENKTTDRNRPWFIVTSKSFREKARSFGKLFAEENETSTYCARLITLALFAIAYLIIVTHSIRSENSHKALLSGCFWIVAVFFCLQPTQNPWYWTWALPFVVFTRVRSWHFYSALLLIYYYRFWFSISEGEYHWMGNEYNGEYYFHFVIVWFEHLPLFIAVACETCYRWIFADKI